MKVALLFQLRKREWKRRSFVAPTSGGMRTGRAPTARRPARGMRFGRNDAAVGRPSRNGTRSFSSSPMKKPTPRLEASASPTRLYIAERVVGPNRESHIPTVCEMLDIRTPAQDPLTLGVCLDKSRAKEILSYHRIPNRGLPWIGRDAVRQSCPRRPASGHRQAAPPRGRARGSRTTPSSAAWATSTSVWTRSRRPTSSRSSSSVFLTGPRVSPSASSLTPELRDPADRGDRPQPATLGGGPDLLLRSEMGSGTDRKIRWTSNPRSRPPCPRCSRPRSRTSSRARAPCSASGTGAGSTSGSMKKESANILEVSDPLPGILPKPEDNSACPRRPGRRGILIRT